MRPVLRPERLVAGGEALARDESGRVVFVAGALPGERVAVEITRRQRDFAKGRAVDILEASDVRCRPTCPHRRSGCGGCGWMHIDPAAQLDAKVDIVLESLTRIGRLEPERAGRLVVAAGSVPALEYRTTVRVVGSAAGRPGFRRDRSDEVIPVDSCPVAHPQLSRLLAAVEVDPGVELTLRTSVATAATTARWAGRRAAVRGLPAAVHTGDRAWLRERVAGRDLRVSAGSFFQSGPAAAELLVDAVRRGAPEAAGGRRVVDAYGGVGLFAATALSGAEHVVLLESSRHACADARLNLAGVDALVIEGDAARWRAGGRAVDVVVADPARAGLGRRGVEAMASAAPAPIVLISCDPVAMARDAALLADRGYRAVAIEVFDLFPQTPHVETVTRFEAGGAGVP